MKLRAPGPKAIRVAAVGPNLGVKAAYLKRLVSEIDAMHKDVLRAVTKAWAANPPHALLAKDASPASDGRKVVAALRRWWTKRFKDGADTLAKHFTDDTLRHQDVALQSALRKAGFSVKFQATRPMNDAYQAVRHEQVHLIKSIPAQHLDDVEGLVLRSVQHGHDMGQLSKDLQERYEITKRRAAFIARDQNNKATAVFNRVRKLDLGITKSRLIHTLASKHPRDSHEAAAHENGGIYDTAVGFWDDAVGKFVQPGEEPNCGCISEGRIPGLGEEDGDEA